ncbi:MAG: exo-alpha-sialidase [Candidatus Hydrogenedentes bacterium]|nr:exo-alpha-sialidase [Candidatus Hydrogenedentota bacterium]
MFAKSLLLLCAFAVSAAPGQFSLWDSSVPLPASAEVRTIQGVEFHVIKLYEPDADGFHWLHGVALAWEKDRLICSFGHNAGSENTASERADFRTSLDAGATWGPVRLLAKGEGNEAVSHGVFGHDGKSLWAFLGSFEGFRENVHTHTFQWDEDKAAWQDRGIAAGDGFWPMNQPIQTRQGRWVMPGIIVGGQFGSTANPAAVALCDTGDFAHWRVVPIPKPGNLVMWGESALLADADDLICIARNDGSNPVALASVSHDGGENWSEMAPSNLPMAASKPCAGTLSTGQHYLIGTTTADAGNRRSPLTIAVSRPGERLFSAVFTIRGAESPGAGESTPNAALSYPYAVEHEGKLYVTYSNDGGRGSNANSAELAIIPVEALAAP